MVGLEVWVRAEAAVPLFCALGLTELLFVYRNNTARAQLQNVTKIGAVICLANHKINYNLLAIPSLLTLISCVNLAECLYIYIY